MFRDVESAGGMPSGAIHEQDGVSAVGDVRDISSDAVAWLRYRVWQREGRAGSARGQIGRTDRRSHSVDRGLTRPGSSLAHWRTRRFSGRCEPRLKPDFDGLVLWHAIRWALKPAESFFESLDDLGVLAGWADAR